MSVRAEAVVDQVIGDHVHCIVQLLQRAGPAQQVTVALQYAAAVFLAQPLQLESLPQVLKHDGLPKAHERLQAALQTYGAEAIRKVYWERHFTTFAEAVLSELTGEVLSALSDAERSIHLDIWFRGAPADALLAALTSYLSSVQPNQSLQQARQSSVSVSPIAADLAGRFLAERFARVGSTGVAELAAIFAAQNASSSGHLAGLLASIPERAASSQLPALQAEQFVPQLTRQILSLLAACAHLLDNGSADSSNRGTLASTSEPSALPGTQTGINAACAASTSKEAAFAGEVLGKLSRRGYSSLIARTLWASLAAPGSSPGSGMVFGAALATVGDAVGRERLLEALLAVAGTSGLEKGSLLGALRQAVLQGDLMQRRSVRYLLQEKLLMQSLLPPLALEVLIDLLHSISGTPAAISLKDLALNLCQVWGDAESVQRLPPKRQAYLTAALILCLQRLGREGLAPSSALPAALIAGVSVRLDQPIESLRWQGMRVGRMLAATLDPERPLFQDLGPLDMLPDEIWHPDCSGTGFGIPSFPPPADAVAVSPPVPADPTEAPEHRAPKEEAPEGIWEASHQVSTRGWPSQTAASAKSGQSASKELLGLEEGGASTSKLSEAATESDSDDDVEPYNLDEADSDDGGMDGDKPLQLRDVADMLRKSDEPQAVIRGLTLLGPLIEAAPEELAIYSGELARALLFARPPEWDDLQSGPEEQRPEVQRLRAMVSLVTEVPLAGGLALANEIYSPHLDLHQRLLILDSLSTAARELSTAPSRARRDRAAIEASGTDQAADTRLTGGLGGVSSGGVAKVGKTRRWGVRSLAQLRAPEPKTFRNRFPEVANEWVGALLRDAEHERHGIDLFGRDQLLLGRLLITLGGFVEAAAPSVQSVQLAAVVLELLHAPALDTHPQPFVRRAALVAASQVLSGLPPARLGGAMIGRRNDVQDTLLVERLEWLRGRLLSAAESDPDPQVKALAAGCINLQASLAMKALESIETGNNTSGGDVPWQNIQLPGSQSAQQRLNISIPGIAELRLT